MAAMETDMSLKKIAEYVEAEEQGTRSAKLLGNGVGTLNRISNFKRTQDPMRTQSNILPTGQTDKDTVDQGKCGWCAKTGHWSREETEVSFRNKDDYFLLPHIII